MSTRTAGAVLAVLSVAACGSGGGVSAARTDATLLVHEARGRADDAGTSGYVRYLAEADCFVLDSSPDGADGVRDVAVWPPGTRVWLADGRVAGVHVPDREPIPVGSRLTGGGGFANPDTSELDLPAVDADCLRGGGEFAMIHIISAVS